MDVRCRVLLVDCVMVKLPCNQTVVWFTRKVTIVNTCTCSVAMCMLPGAMDQPKQINHHLEVAEEGGLPRETRKHEEGPCPLLAFQLPGHRLVVYPPRTGPATTKHRGTPAWVMPHPAQRPAPPPSKKQRTTGIVTTGCPVTVNGVTYEIIARQYGTSLPSMLMSPRVRLCLNVGVAMTGSTQTQCSSSTASMASRASVRVSTAAWDKCTRKCGTWMHMHAWEAEPKSKEGAHGRVESLGQHVFTTYLHSIVFRWFRVRQPEAAKIGMRASQSTQQWSWQWVHR